MDISKIIFLAVGIILVFLLVKVINKVFKMIILLGLIALAAVYGFFYFNKINNISDLHEKYCANISDRNDSLTCFYIVAPLEEELHTQYSENALKEMSSEKFMVALSRAVIARSSEISTNLKKNNAYELLTNFKKEVGGLDSLLRKDNQ
ncbi:MAG: hypothetical protein CSB06_03615 [Bacteroidia bacterium]|nr:MAG: hypothetical protein CSB06_03615 [Bacteroidia bacterium]